MTKEKQDYPMKPIYDIMNNAIDRLNNVKENTNKDLKTVILNFISNKCFVPLEYCDQLVTELYENIEKIGYTIQKINIEHFGLPVFSHFIWVSNDNEKIELNGDRKNGDTVIIFCEWDENGNIEFIAEIDNCLCNLKPIFK